MEDFCGEHLCSDFAWSQPSETSIFGWSFQLNWRMVYGISMLIAGFVFPLCVIALAYSRIVKKLKNVRLKTDYLNLK